MYRPSCFFIFLFPGLLDLGEIRSANSGPAKANCRGGLVCCLVFNFLKISFSGERVSSRLCVVVGNITESDSKLNSDR